MTAITNQLTHARKSAGSPLIPRRPHGPLASVNPRTALTRRHLLRLAALTVAGGATAAAGGAGWARWVEPGWLTLVRVQVPIAGLPAAFDGFRIALLSDLHLYPHTTLEYVSHAVEVVRSLDADVAVLTGDFVYQNAEAVFDLAAVLATLDARQGVFGVLGNHDYWTNAAVVRAGLREAGVSLLENRGIALTSGRDRIYLAGVDDYWSGTPDLAAALSSAPSGVPVVLLSHEPDPVDEYGWDGRVALQLSGHSHGGQVRLPGIGAPVLPVYGRKYDMGLNRAGSAWVYTTRGVGVIGPPVRLNCPPEVTEVTLVPAGD